MAKKRQAPDSAKGKSTADYYKLHVDAIERLVTADESNSPPVDEKELRRYHKGPQIRLSDWLKALLIKAWFAGVVCYFFYFGLGGMLGSLLDILFVLGLALGFVTDLLTNNVLRFIEKNEGAYARWMMFPQKKKHYTLPLNVLYAFVLILFVATTYRAVNGIIAVTGSENGLGVEPVLFGVFTTAWDCAFLAMKRAFRKIVAEAKEKAQNTQSK